MNTKMENKGKKIKVIVNKEAQEELNTIRKKCGLKPRRIKPDFELECLFK